VNSKSVIITGEIGNKRIGNKRGGCLTAKKRYRQFFTDLTRVSFKEGERDKEAGNQETPSFVEGVSRVRLPKMEIGFP
jgi:hypothetical protein